MKLVYEKFVESINEIKIDLIKIIENSSLETLDENYEKFVNNNNLYLHITIPQVNENYWISQMRLYREKKSISFFNTNYNNQILRNIYMERIDKLLKENNIYYTKPVKNKSFNFIEFNLEIDNLPKFYIYQPKLKELLIQFNLFQNNHPLLKLNIINQNEIKKNLLVFSLVASFIDCLFNNNINNINNINNNNNNNLETLEKNYELVNEKLNNNIDNDNNDNIDNNYEEYYSSERRISSNNTSDDYFYYCNESAESENEDIIEFYYELNQPLNKYIFSKKITHLYFGHCFNQIIKEGVLPSTITHIKFGHRYNQIINPNCLPKNLTHIIFGNKYNQLIDKNVLPKNLTHLIFGSDYNQIINKDVLPDSLTHITFGWFYNQIIRPNILPKSLTHLTFGVEFNQVITKNVLPNNLLYLRFGYYYNHKINENILPINLRKIIFTRKCQINLLSNKNKYRNIIKIIN